MKKILVFAALIVCVYSSGCDDEEEVKPLMKKIMNQRFDDPVPPNPPPLSIKNNK